MKINKTKQEVIADLEELPQRMTRSLQPETGQKPVEEVLSIVYDALNSSVNGVIITDLEGHIKYANPAFLKMFEYDDSFQVVDKDAADLFPSEQVHKFSDVKAMTIHGLQFKNPSKKLQPTGYYGKNSGLGLTMNNFPRQEKRRIGGVGLGVGTILAYCRPSDYFRFYEINPEVVRFARTEFSYMANCKGKIDVALGDARMSLEKETNQGFDILVLDAFSGASVPVHLLTKKAFELYLRHIKPDGVIAFHISSGCLDLSIIIGEMSQYFKLKSVLIENRGKKAEGLFPSKWVLSTYNEKFIEQIETCGASVKYPRHLSQINLWTDDHVNMLDVIR